MIQAKKNAILMSASRTVGRFGTDIFTQSSGLKGGFPT